MSSNPFDLAEQLQFLGASLMSGASNVPFKTPVTQKVRKTYKKPRKSVSEFSEPLRRNEQNSHATSTMINKSRTPLRNFHERQDQNLMKFHRKELRLRL